AYDSKTTSGKNMCDREWRNHKNYILVLLSKSNNKRNKLNLTHASDSLIDYTDSIRNSLEKVSNQEIDDLFKIVSYLVTGVN
ncbi:MAG: hypothetical protein LH609_02360, partial [Rudanella sp.]|nr:hypothetical protein [Rudanella sp.]